MPKTKPQTAENDGLYLLKLVLYLIIGAQWLFLSWPAGRHLPLPVGVLIGGIFASHEHFRIDRKIEYAVLLVAMLVGYFAQVGVYISV